MNYICLTEFNKAKLQHLKQIKSEQIFVKPNFVEAEDRYVPYERRQEQFIYVGRLEEIKGIDVLLEAWKIMGKTAPKLLICGSGPLEPWAKEFVQKNDLSQIEFLGFVPNTEVRKLIGDSKALILPTKVYEGFPMTIAESYACGTPVIGSDLGNTGSLIENGISGYKITTGSPTELTEAIKNIKDSFAGLSEEIIEKYSSESNYQNLRGIYEACCHHH